MADADGGAGKVCTFKKPLFKKKGSDPKGKIRKRVREEDHPDSEGSSEEESVLLTKQAAAKGARGNGGSKAAKTVASGLPLGAYASNRSTVPVEAAGGATYEYQVDTEHDRDQRAMMEMAIKVQEEGATNDDTKLYRGQAFYKNYIPKDAAQVGSNKFTGTQGPIRAPTYLRSTCVFDYKPDICKDYKETGFCGFGDSCKFIHDRSDYKSGYELEAEWEVEQKRKRARELGEWAEESDDEDKYVINPDDDLPFACFLCRNGFRDPVVTMCGHYFCSTCALEHNKNDPKCPACGEKTGGVFNFARKLYEKMKRDEATQAAIKEKEDARAAVRGGGRKTDAVGDEGDGADDEGNGGDAAEEGEGIDGDNGKLRIAHVDRQTVVTQKKGSWGTVS